jgi:hypothetical protein
MKGADSADVAAGNARESLRRAADRSNHYCLLPRRLLPAYWSVIVTNEARRLIARPSAVLLSAFGRSSP